ncbi:hypothetical protein [Mycobacterium sp. 23]|uniref:hypothetical protein n=1 Tax=Mycobacterium sp. 23 TaxID=3400424 RepID=UPI003AAE55CD
MTAATERYNPALRATRQHLAHYDRNRDDLDQERRVRHLALVGASEVETAAVTGLSTQTVGRIRNRPPEPDRPEVPDGRVTDARAAELEDTADLALHLAMLLRDEDPNLTWGTLSQLRRRQLQELTVIALASIPIDMTRDQLLTWVHDLPAARTDI